LEQLEKQLKEQNMLDEDGNLCLENVSDEDFLNIFYENEIREGRLITTYTNSLRSRHERLGLTDRELVEDIR